MATDFERAFWLMEREFRFWQLLAASGRAHGLFIYKILSPSFRDCRFLDSPLKCRVNHMRDQLITSQPQALVSHPPQMIN